MAKIRQILQQLSWHDLKILSDLPNPQLRWHVLDALNASDPLMPPASHNHMLNFGKHRGERLSEVAEPYLRWLTAYSPRPIWKERAKTELARRGAAKKDREPQRTSEPKTSPMKTSDWIGENKILGFGKYKGFALADVPAEYLYWVTQTSGYPLSRKNVASEELTRRDSLAD